MISNLNLKSLPSEVTETSSRPQVSINVLFHYTVCRSVWHKNDLRRSKKEEMSAEGGNACLNKGSQWEKKCSVVRILNATIFILEIVP